MYHWNNNNLTTIDHYVALKQQQLNHHGHHVPLKQLQLNHHWPYPPMVIMYHWNNNNLTTIGHYVLLKKQLNFSLIPGCLHRDGTSPDQLLNPLGYNPTYIGCSDFRQTLDESSEIGY
jgi:hypothetical protein